MIFKDRQQAGLLLADKLAAYSGKTVLVLGLARGGMTVAATLASKLNLPLEVLVVKKISSPYDRELAVGAVAPDGVRVVHWPTLLRSGADEAYLKTQVAALTGEIEKLLRFYRKGRKPMEVRGKTVILVDDGIATGSSLEAAIAWNKQKKAQKIIVAVPVAAPEVLRRLQPEVAELVVLEQPEDLTAVGAYYENFQQVTEEEVLKLLSAVKK